MRSFFLVGLLTLAGDTMQPSPVAWGGQAIHKINREIFLQHRIMKIPTYGSYIVLEIYFLKILLILRLISKSGLHFCPWWVNQESALFRRTSSTNCTEVYVHSQSYSGLCSIIAMFLRWFREDIRALYFTSKKGNEVFM